MKERIGKKRSQISQIAMRLKKQRSNHADTLAAIKGAQTSVARDRLHETALQEEKEILQSETALTELRRELSTMTHASTLQTVFTLEENQEAEEMLDATERVVQNMEERQFLNKEKDAALLRDPVIQDRILQKMRDKERDEEEARQRESIKQVERQPLLLEHLQMQSNIPSRSLTHSSRFSTHQQSSKQVAIQKQQQHHVHHQVV